MINTINAHIKQHELYLLRIEDYNKNPKLCKFCNVPISYDKRKNNFVHTRVRLRLIIREFVE